MVENFIDLCSVFFDRTFDSLKWRRVGSDQKTNQNILNYKHSQKRIIQLLITNRLLQQSWNHGRKSTMVHEFSTGKNHFVCETQCIRYWYQTDRINFRFTKVKRNYLAKNPLEKCDLIYRIHAFLFKFLGVHIVVANFKPNINTLIPIYLVVNYFTLLIYTWYHYRNEFFNILITTPFFGVFVPVCWVFPPVIALNWLQLNFNLISFLFVHSIQFYWLLLSSHMSVRN